MNNFPGGIHRFLLCTMILMIGSSQCNPSLQIYFSKSSPYRAPDGPPDAMGSYIDLIFQLQTPFVLTHTPHNSFSLTSLEYKVKWTYLLSSFTLSLFSTFNSTSTTLLVCFLQLSLLGLLINGSKETSNKLGSTEFTMTMTTGMLLLNNLTQIIRLVVDFLAFLQ